MTTDLGPAVAGASAPALTARQILLSTLLGTDPPRLPVARLVRAAELFDVAEGTARTALSRMAAAGEVIHADGWYELAGPLLDRGDRQRRARHPARRPWDGTWVVVVVRAGGRSRSERDALRRAARAARLGALRDGVWARPDNLDEPLPDALVHHADHFRSARPAAGPDDQVGHPPAGGPDTGPADDGARLAVALWDLDAWAADAAQLGRQVRDLSGRLDSDPSVPDPPVLREGFVVSAAVLRHLLADPLLPDELTPPGWPARSLRDDYDRFDSAYRAALLTLFESAGR